VLTTEGRENARKIGERFAITYGTDFKPEDMYLRSTVPERCRQVSEMFLETPHKVDQIE